MRSLSSSYYKRRKRRMGCIGKLISFVISIFIFICLGNYLLLESGLKEQIMKTQYPLKYQEFVQEYATMYSLEEPLVYSLIRTESKFDPYAVSRTDARGLMQVQSETALDCAKELKIQNFSTDALFDPKLNIQIGCYYFSKLLKRYHGNCNLAIAAYNGGPGNVEKWLKENEYTDDYGNLVHIPFPETRNYVKRVAQTYEIYCKLYPTMK